LARLAPVNTDGIRPWTLLKPCDLSRKYVGVLDEQPMPESFATRCGWIASSQQAWMIAALMESCPQPAQSVEIAPSKSRRVRPREFFGRSGWWSFGFAR